MEELEKMTCRPMKQRKFLGSWYGGRRWVFDPQRGAWIGAMLPPNFLLEEERTSEDEAANEVRDTAREKDEGGEKRQEKEICSFEEEEVEEEGEREEKRVHIYLCSKNVYLMGKVKSKVQGLLVRVWEARHAAECAAGGKPQQQQQQRFTFRRQPHTFPPSQHIYYGYYPPTIPHYLLQVDASLQQPQQQQADTQAAQQPQQGQHMQQGYPTYVQPHMYYQQPMYHHMYYTTHAPPTVVQHDPAQAQQQQQQQQQHPQPTTVVGEESSEPQSDSEGEAIMPEPTSASVETSASSAHPEGQPLYRSPRTAPYVLSEYPPPLYMSPHPFSPPPHPAANNPQEKQAILGTPPPQHVAPMWTQQQMYMIPPHMAYHPYQLQQPLPPQHVQYTQATLQYSHWQEQPASGLPDKQPRMTDSNVAAASAHVH